MGWKDRRCDNVRGYVAQVESRLLVLCAGTSDNLAQERDHSDINVVCEPMVLTVES